MIKDKDEPGEYKLSCKDARLHVLQVNSRHSCFVRAAVGQTLVAVFSDKGILRPPKSRA